jgi:SAM-dependent methyltransferase
VIRDLFKYTYRKNKKYKDFKTSAEYWERRYKSGGNSGAGSYNNLAEFKGDIINSFIQDKKIVSVIEFGCGDGNQLKYLSFQKYLGFDVSKKAVEICTQLYKHDDRKNFKQMSSYKYEKADLTLSLDVVFHLVEEQSYVNYMNTLFESSYKYVIVYSSNTDENTFSSKHVKHRKFTDWVEINQQDFRLLEYIPNKYSFDGDEMNTSFADFFVYEKKE